MAQSSSFKLYVSKGSGSKPAQAKGKPVKVAAGKTQKTGAMPKSKKAPKLPFVKY